MASISFGASLLKPISVKSSLQGQPVVPRGIIPATRRPSLNRKCLVVADATAVADAEVSQVIEESFLTAEVADVAPALDPLPTVDGSAAVDAVTSTAPPIPAEAADTTVDQLKEQLRLSFEAPPSIPKPPPTSLYPSRTVAPNLDGPNIKFSAPKFEVPKFEAPKFEAPSFEMPKFEAPKFEVPKFEAPKFEVPKFEVPNFDKLEAPKLEDLQIPGVELPKIDLPKFELPFPKFESPQSIPLPQLRLPKQVTEPVQGAYDAAVQSANEAAAAAAAQAGETAGQLYLNLRESVPPEALPILDRIEVNLASLKEAAGSFTADASVQVTAALTVAVRAAFAAAGYDADDSVVNATLIGIGGVTFGLILWRLVAASYAGYLSPEECLELLREKKAVLVDIRPEGIRDADGILDLRRGARSKDCYIEFDKLRGPVRGQLKGADNVDLLLMAAKIRGIRGVTKSTQVIVMDNKGSRLAKDIASGAARYGFRRSFVMSGGFQGWAAAGLRVKENAPEPAAEVLKKEFEAFIEEVRPTPVGVASALAGVGIGVYALVEWQRSIQLLGFVIAATIVYTRFQTYKSQKDLEKDLKLLVAPLTLFASLLTWGLGAATASAKTADKNEVDLTADDVVAALEAAKEAEAEDEAEAEAEEEAEVAAAEEASLEAAEAVSLDAASEVAGESLPESVEEISEKELAEIAADLVAEEAKEVAEVSEKAEEVFAAGIVAEEAKEEPATENGTVTVTEEVTVSSEPTYAWQEASEPASDPAPSEQTEAAATPEYLPPAEVSSPSTVTPSSNPDVVFVSGASQPSEAENK